MSYQRCESKGYADASFCADWHSRESGGSSDEGLSSREDSSSRTSRPRSLLSQRDVNVDLPSSDNSDREAHKIARHHSAVSQRRRRSHQHVPLPPIPVTIEEVDEDVKSRKSGTPTSRTSRHRRRPETKEDQDPLRPTVTPPNITSRTRARRVRSGQGSLTDEQVAPSRVTRSMTKEAAAATAAAGLRVRGMR